MNGYSHALWRLLRDILLVAVGIFMLLHETLRETPRFIVFMVGLVVLAGPTAIRTVAVEWFGRGQKAE